VVDFVIGNMNYYRMSLQRHKKKQTLSVNPYLTK